MKNDNSKKLVSKYDVVLLVLLVVASIIAVVLLSVDATPGLAVKISVDGEIIETLRMNHDTEYIVDSTSGKNTIMIKNGVVSVSYADCPDKICVKHNPISKAGETIICLPHKLVVEIYK